MWMSYYEESNMLAKNGISFTETHPTSSTIKPFLWTFKITKKLHVYHLLGLTARTWVWAVSGFCRFLSGFDHDKSLNMPKPSGLSNSPDALYMPGLAISAILLGGFKYLCSLKGYDVWIIIPLAFFSSKLSIIRIPPLNLVNLWGK